MFSEYCSISALSLVLSLWWWCDWCGWWWYSQWLLCLIPTTVMVVLLLGLGLLLGCDNSFSLFLNFYDVSSLSCRHSRIIQYFIESFLCNLHNHIIFNSLHLFSIGQYKGRREQYISVFENFKSLLSHFWSCSSQSRRGQYRVKFI